MWDGGEAAYTNMGPPQAKAVGGARAWLRLPETDGARQNGQLRLPGHVRLLKLRVKESNEATIAMTRTHAFVHVAKAGIMLASAFRKAELP